MAESETYTVSRTKRACRFWHPMVASMLILLL